MSLIPHLISGSVAAVALCSSTAFAQDAAKTTIAPGAGRLGFFAEKIRKREPVLVAAIGGSITQGSGASNAGNGYIWKAIGKLQQTIAASGGTMQFQWAPAGGTNSTYGAYRVGAQLLKAKPDLLIVEFAVNDANNPETLNGMEGIVRQAWRANPKMGLVFFETTKASFETDFYAKNAVPPSVETHRQVAAHYNVAEVNAGPVTHAALQNGTFTPETFWKDGTHPTDSGHALYAEVLSTALLTAVKEPAPPAVPPLPALLGKGELESARFESITPIAPAGWTASDKDWFTSHKWSATEAKPLTFPTSGRRAALLYRGAIQVKWKTPDGPEGNTTIRQPGPTPSPALYNFPGEGLPAGTLVTAEPIAGPDGKVNAEIYGVFSLKIPDAAF